MTAHPVRGRVSKADATIELAGRVDETVVTLNEACQVCEEANLDDLHRALERSMRDLWWLVTQTGDGRKADDDDSIDSVAEVRWLESEIDALDAQLPALDGFIVPGGCPAARRLHEARVQVRALERLLHAPDMPPQNDAVYALVNRMSDFLFVAARYANFQCGHAESML